jgi:hypothetical protein
MWSFVPMRGVINCVRIGQCAHPARQAHGKANAECGESCRGPTLTFNARFIGVDRGRRQAMKTRSALAQARGRRRARYIWSADLDELLIEACTRKTERWRAFRAIAKRT